MNQEIHEQAQADVQRRLSVYPLLVDPSDARTQEQVIEDMVTHRYTSLERTMGMLSANSVAEIQSRV